MSKAPKKGKKGALAKQTRAALPTQADLDTILGLIDAARAQVTVGESMRALESVFGTWYERSVV